MKTLSQEKQEIERNSFLEIMNPILAKLKVAQLTSNEFMAGMDACSEIIQRNHFRFAYDYLVAYLISTAPELPRERYLDVAHAVLMMGSYMHRFEIPRAKLPTLSEVSQAQLPRCLP